MFHAQLKVAGTEGRQFFRHGADMLAYLAVRLHESLVGIAIAQRAPHSDDAVAASLEIDGAASELVAAEILLRNIIRGVDRGAAETQFLRRAHDVNPLRPRPAFSWLEHQRQRHGAASLGERQRDRSGKSILRQETRGAQLVIGNLYHSWGTDHGRYAGSAESLGRLRQHRQLGLDAGKNQGAFSLAADFHDPRQKFR